MNPRCRYIPVVLVAWFVTTACEVAPEPAPLEPTDLRVSEAAASAGDLSYTWSWYGPCWNGWVDPSSVPEPAACPAGYEEFSSNATTAYCPNGMCQCTDALSCAHAQEHAWGCPASHPWLPVKGRKCKKYGLTPTAPSAGTSPISSKPSGMCLAVSGASTADLATIAQTSCGTADHGSFSFVPGQNSDYSIIARHSGKCLDIPGSSTADGVGLIQYTCHGGPNQKFQVSLVSDGLYRIVARHSGKCLEVSGTGDGAPLVQSPCHGGDSQKFAIDGGIINLALRRPATQSSLVASGPADHAVDGDPDGDYGHRSVTHTNSEAQPWWQVDLGQDTPVGQVILWNRTDCCAERLANFQLLASSDGVSWSSYPYPGIAGRSVSFNVNRRARYVKVQLNATGIISLAEVEVRSPANWKREPVFIKSVAHNKYLGIQTSPYWPYGWEMYSRIGEARSYYNTGDPIPWRFRPGVAPGKYEIVGLPPEFASHREDYMLCAVSDSGFRLTMYRASSVAGNPWCTWSVEDLGDGKMRLRNHALDTQYGTYVGRLKCWYDYDCVFDYHGLPDNHPQLLFEYMKTL